MANKITLGSGLETFEIDFKDRGTTTEIAFNPSDPDLMKRLFEAQKTIEERTKEVQKYELDEKGVPNTDSCIEYFNGINEIIYDAVDYAFGNRISDKIFQYCSPFAIVGGEYYILQFFNRITPVLEKIIGEKQKKASANANKHLAKYMKAQ